MNEGPNGARRALVIGGGIAGPALALFLQRAGLAPVVYEAWPHPADEAGAFLNLAPSGLEVLETLGIRATVEAMGTPTTEIAFFNHRGKALGKLAEPLLLIKRGLLNKALREATVAAAIPFHFSKRLQAIEQTPHGTVVARFEDGSQAEGDLLVGCDGIHSQVRPLILPAAPAPTYTGLLDTGAFTHCATVPPTEGTMRMTFGLRAFFGYQVTPSGEVYWFQNFSQPHAPARGELDAITDAEWRRRLLAMHCQDHAPIAALISATEGRMGRWALYDMPSLPTWHQGRVGLIGDAAHATTPHAGHGASLALEDAIVLAQCLRDIPEVPRAFATFQALRQERVDRRVREARRTGNQKAPPNALMRHVRDLVLPFFLKQGSRSMAEFYRYRVDWGERVGVAG